MKKPAQMIKHDLLNIFTAMSHLLHEKRMSREKKKKLLELTELSALLIKHQDTFMKKRPQFFYQEVSLQDLLETSLAPFHEDDIKTKKIILPQEEVMLRLDRFYVSEAMKQLLKKILKHSQEVQIQYDIRTRTMKIHHTWSKQLFLREEKKSDAGLELSFTIFRMCKIHVKETKGIVLLNFSSQQY